MRLARLDLIRFGRFTDVSIELPAGKRDLHIVFGPNEAGKTTAMTAIEDLLFGIPTRSPYNFLHDYDVMRVGAVLENGSDSLAFRRRKGTRSTILGLDDLPLTGDAGRLAPFLGGADRAFFERMFNLSHQRLAEGGKEILAAEGDVGRMLFSAGTGLSGLRERLKRLEEEADGLWAPRKSGKRLYYQASDRLEEASRQLRAHTLLARDWQQAKKAFDSSEEGFQAVQREYEAASIELRRLGRIRRVYATVRRKNELEQGIAELGDLMLLPESAGSALAEAERSEAETVARIETLTSQRKQAEQQVEALVYDELLVRRAEDIQQLHERRIEVRGEKADLPKRRAELESAVEELTRLALELGWESSVHDRLVERIPARDKVARVRTLLQQRGQLSTSMQSTGNTLGEAQSALADREDRLLQIGEAADVSKLTAVLTAVRGSGDVGVRNRSAQDQVDEASQRIGRLQQSLKPKLPDSTDLATISVPPRAMVLEHRDRTQDWARRLRETRQRLDDARRALERNRKALERRVHEEGVETLDALQDARDVRDSLWGLVKVRYIDGLPISDEQAQPYAERLGDLPGGFENAVRGADAVADRRFDKAETAGRLAELARNIADQETEVEQLAAQELALKDEESQLDQEWRALWNGLLFEAGSPEAMLVWLDGRDDLIDAMERQRQAKRQLEALKTEERDTRARLIAELESFGVDVETMHADTLPILIERAAGFERDQKAIAKQLGEARESVRIARTELARREKGLEQARTAWSSWERAWALALNELSLNVEAEPEVVAAQIEIIEQMRQGAIRAKDLQEKRIGAIERDIAEFARLVAEAVTQVAPDLVGTDAEAAVLEVEQRLETAQELRNQRRDRAETAASLQKQVDELEQLRQQTWASVVPLKQATGTDDIAALKEGIGRSDRRRALDKELASVLETLQRDGDGLAADALMEECVGVDIDQVQARQEAAEAALKALQGRLSGAAEQRAEARRAFQEIGGDDTAARAAAERQEAIASMREAAERYVRVRTSVMLLRWAIDRYRREKQGPLLKSAGELFRVLTSGSFSGLGVQFDDEDRMQLSGVRPNGAAVPVPGLSSGTEDQLFLALRIAAVEDYMGRAVVLPFVADDLFINFDPVRSAAGFEILGRLAEKTQVLFFTHHPHLVDIARNALGADTHVVSLDKMH